MRRADRNGRSAEIAALFVLFAAAPAIAQQPPAPAVSVAPAEMTEVRARAGFTGRVTAEQKVDIVPRVAGFLEEIAFKEGSRVEQGALLYRIQDDDYRAQVAEIEGSIKSAEAQRDLAALERDRKSQLVAKKAVAQNELDVATAELLKAEGDLARLQGSLDRAKLQLSYTEITAPFAGTVGLTTADIGALVGPDTGPLTTLTRLDPLDVTFPVATSIYLTFRERVDKGEASTEDSIQITLPNGTVYPETGTIDYVSADVAQGTDTLTVRASFPNPDGWLLDGALVKVAFEDTRGTQALTVPQQAVQRDQQGAFVLVVGADSKVEVRRVETDATLRGRTVIKSGLEAGENVIVDGINKVRPGITVDAAVATDG
jgi:membrane fusion protein (multidrug efflux system)